MNQGKYIVIEGIDGSGKTSQRDLLAKALKNCGVDVYVTHEPTDGHVGKLIRKMLNKEVEIDKRVLGMLFIADTYDHIVKKDGLLDQINNGKTVISDRSYFSTFAYQSALIPMQWLIDSHSMSMDLLFPNLVIYLDITPQLAFDRIISRGKPLSVHENIEFLKGLRDRYISSFHFIQHLGFGNNTMYTTINADQSVDNVACDVYKKTCLAMGIKE